MQDWELAPLSNFMATIYGASVRGSREDKMCWVLDKKEGFQVSGFYHVLLHTNIQSFPWKSIWKQKIPFGVAFFIWTAALGKILTGNNHRRRLVSPLDWCYMCKCNRELVDHLLLHCPIASKLWSMVSGLFGVCWVMPKSVVDLLACWQGCFGRHRTWVYMDGYPPLLDVISLEGEE